MPRLSFRKFIAVFLFFSCMLVNAQENLSVYNEPEISLELETNTPWSYEFGVAHRRLVYANEEYAMVAKNIELSHFTHYKVGAGSKIGLGLKYKFTELFSETAHDKFLIMEQYDYGKKYDWIKIGHRLRVEERFENEFSVRSRYRLSAKVPLSQSGKEIAGFALSAKTEALLIVSKLNAPRWDQRFGLSLEKGLTEDVAIELGVEYQHEDYTHNPEVDLFILSGISISL